MTRRVLIVDDEPAILDVLGQIMREQGWEAITARSLDEARVAPGPWDLVIADVRLPNGDGRELREMLEGVPFLVVSGHPDQARTGDEHFLAKPFTRAKLLETIAGFVS